MGSAGHRRDVVESAGHGEDGLEVDMTAHGESDLEVETDCLGTVQGKLNAGIEIDTATYHKSGGHNIRRDGGFDAETGVCLGTVQGKLDAGIEIDTAAYHKSGGCRLEAKAGGYSSHRDGGFDAETGGVCLGTVPWVAG